MSSEECEVVKSEALGKEFWYCRTHKRECASFGCYGAFMGDDYVDQYKKWKERQDDLANFFGEDCPDV